jgi:hypothetical protein
MYDYNVTKVKLYARLSVSISFIKSVWRSGLKKVPRVPCVGWSSSEITQEVI